MKFNKSPKEGGGSGNMFLKLKDGESVKVILRGDPYEFYSKWENGKSILSDESDRDARFRFRMNVVVREGNSYVAKIWEQGPTAYNTLKELIDSGYDLEKTILNIKRIGQELNTTYSILPTKFEVTKEIEKEISKLDSHYLGHDVESGSKAPSMDTEEEIPF